MKRLFQVYNQSLEDATKQAEKLQKEFEELEAIYDTVEDEEEKQALKSRMRSKVYQKQYQENIKKQVSDIVDNMQKNSYTTVSDYLEKCYEDGFIGTIYDMHGQGVPLAMPLDQKAMVRAVQLDSKISEGLYNHLGEDYPMLKKHITAQISRGISSGLTTAQIAHNLSGKMVGTYTNPKGAYAYAKRIARTEGHRIQCQATMDAMYSAKDKGADVVKQWDSTLDARTRHSHAKVDGERKEVDEKFSNGLMFPGDPNGEAAEVINCRCALLQIPRWAIGDAFTKMNNFTKQIEEFESPEDYAEFKKGFFSKENRQYMNYVSEMEEKHRTTDFARVLDSMSDREYNHYSKLLAANPTFNTNAPNINHTPQVQTSGTVTQLASVTDYNGLDKYLQNMYNVSVADSVKQLDFESVKEGVDGIDRVLHEFPQAQSMFKGISTSNSGIMCADYDGTINFNPTIFQTRSVALAKHPQTKYYVKGNCVAASGSHEAGHILERALIEKDNSLVSKTVAWQKCTKAQEVVGEACKAVKKLPECKGKYNRTLKEEISGYANDDASECMAEAVSDYIVNGENAAVLSKEIWKILKRELG